MSTITIFSNQCGWVGDHSNHVSAQAIVRCDDCYDTCFIDCIGISDMYDVINNLELQNTHYNFEYDLIK